MRLNGNKFKGVDLGSSDGYNFDITNFVLEMLAVSHKTKELSRKCGISNHTFTKIDAQRNDSGYALAKMCNQTNEK
jgi:hypothetical protein